MLPAFPASADLNARNLNRDTPLMFACAKGQIGTAAGAYTCYHFRST
jgi:ankyrin repeat protein